MHVVRVFEVPPEPKQEPPPIPDMTSSYRDVISAGLAPVGRIQPHRFWRLPVLGDPMIFRGARVPTPRLRASIALLWDFSGSQSTFVESLVNSLDMIGTALSHLKISVWAGAYTSGLPQGGHYATDLYQVCSWTEKWDRRRAQTLMRLEHFMDGTPTGRAIRFVRQHIMPAAPDHRRMLVVCTDGAPGDLPIQDDEIRRLRTDGVVVVGLYVGDRDGRARLDNQFGGRYSFAAPERGQIPQVFTEILGRLRG